MRKESEAEIYERLSVLDKEVHGKGENGRNGTQNALKQHSDIGCLAWVQDNSKFLSMAAIAKHIDCDRHNFTRYMKTGTLPSKYVPKLVSFVNVLLNSI